MVTCGDKEEWTEHRLAGARLLTVIHFGFFWNMWNYLVRKKKAHVENLNSKIDTSGKYRDMGKEKEMGMILPDGFCFLWE